MILFLITIVIKDDLKADDMEMLKILIIRKDLNQSGKKEINSP